ncbi:hypothetical protein LO772_12665 [Yinghuangia sp. ASG 101]|uniref:hypothetical protein n=1 Tax=Yinghuangia sp. ASG 101 TaxID=2896848 RepID=UPI001E3AB0DC|nr:hypothetical protein [Yinghuangia sp. ASG 101]UGQ14358.1 hypothetical protein LO772_12665 [Yinghuangia sp. ASG 101]
MKDMRVKELLGIAAQGFTAPDDPDAVDAIIARADRLRRRRRIAYAACSAVAVVAVGVGTALLPQPGLGAPNTRTNNRIAASEPPAPPVAPPPSPEDTAGAGAPSTTAAPAPTAPSAEATTGAPPPTPDPVTSAPSATTTIEATKSPTTRATSSTPPPKSTNSAAASPAVPTAAGNAATRTAAEVVAGYLPSDAGTVTKDARAAGTSRSHPLSGTYLVAKNGRTGIIQVAVHDPAVNPGDPFRTVEDELTYNHCAPDPYAPANTDCTTDKRADGSVLKTWTRPGDQPDSESSLVYGKGYSASVTYPDGRAVVITALAGITGSDTYGKPMDAPPLGKSAVAEVARDTAWFAS